MSEGHDRRALAILVAGACIIGIGPVLVRLADTGPAASAFWRLAFALPLMALLAAAPWRRPREDGEIEPRGPTRAALLAGVFFAADIACWHYGIHYTSVANATVLSNMTPVLVALVAWIVYRERPGRVFSLALAMAVGGALMIGLAKGGGGRGVDPPLGDALSALTAVFYAGYFLCVREARKTRGAAVVMLWSGLVSAPLLLAMSLILRESLIPASTVGWAAVAALGVMHVSGQGAIAWALGRLPTSLTALVVLVQPVVAATLGWLAFAERITLLQALGGALTLAGVALAQAAPRRSPAEAAPAPA